MSSRDSVLKQDTTKRDSSIVFSKSSAETLAESIANALESSTPAPTSRLKSIATLADLEVTSEDEDEVVETTVVTPENVEAVDAVISAVQPVTPTTQNVDSILASFEKDFLSVYKECILKRVRETLKGAVPNPRLLRSAAKREIIDLAPGIVKCGWLTKQGVRVKSWKRRWFVLRANGSVEYKTSEQANSALGQVELAGYRVIDEDCVPGKAYSFRLEPKEGQGRVWPLVASSADDRAGWIRSFVKICEVANEYSNPDADIERAFLDTYRRLRGAAGLNWVPPTRNEVTCIIALVREVTNAPPSEELTATVTSMWQRVQELRQQAKSTTEDQLPKTISNFKAIEKETRSKLNEKAPIPPKIFVSIRPLLSLIETQVITQLQSIYASLYHQIETTIKSGTNTPADVKGVIAQLPLLDVERWEAIIDKLISSSQVSSLPETLRMRFKQHFALLRDKPSLPFGKLDLSMVNFSVDTHATLLAFAEHGLSAEEAQTQTINALHNDLGIEYKQIAVRVFHTFVDGPLIDELLFQMNAVLNDPELAIPDPVNLLTDPSQIYRDILFEAIDLLVQQRPSLSLSLL